MRQFRSGASAVIYVDDTRVVALKKRVAAINRRAADLGVSALRLEDQGTTLCRAPCGRSVAGHRMLFNLPEIRLGGWRVIGRLHALEERVAALCLSEVASDESHLQQLAAGGLRCDHCSYSRRRSECYVIRRINDGVVRILGATCVSSVTSGNGAVLDIVSRFDGLLDEFDENLAPCGSGAIGAGSCEGANGYLDLAQYLADVLFVWEEDGGFVSKVLSQATKLEPTYERASKLESVLATNGALAVRYRESRARCLNEAREAIEWVSKRESKVPFEQRLSHMARQGRLVYERRLLAQVAVIVVLYRKHVVNLQQAKASSVHVGAVGQECEMDLTIMKVVRMPDAGGLRWHLVLMNDERGNHINWRTANVSEEVMRGAGLTMRARFQIKEHAHYRGVCQTLVSHLNVLRWVGAQSGQQ